jgi:hypothetical protein
MVNNARGYSLGDQEEDGEITLRTLPHPLSAQRVDSNGAICIRKPVELVAVAQTDVRTLMLKTGLHLSKRTGLAGRSTIQSFGN